MSNRQARREQMRANRQQRAAQRPANAPRQSRPSQTGGPSRKGGGGFLGFITQPFVLVAIALAVMLGGLVVWFALSGDSESDAMVTQLEEAAANLPLDLADGRFLGEADAPITLTSYEDFQCPFCLRYTAEQEPQIIEEFVKAGEVRLEFKNLPILGTESLRAARASVCAAEQNVFWPFQNSLFLKQAQEDQIGNEQIDVGRFSDDALRDFAVAAGADGEEYDTCFAADASLAQVQADISEASSFGISGTPGFAINGVPLGGGTPSDMDGWREIFDSVLEEQASATASPSPEGTPSAEATDTPSASPTGSAAASPSASATPTP